MFAVCRGKIGEDTMDFHCDTMRSDWQSSSKKKTEDQLHLNGVLTISPTNFVQIQEIKYLKSGVIYHQNIEIVDNTLLSSLSPIDIDFQYYLNLNHLKLVDSRKNAYEPIRQTLMLWNKQKKSQEFIEKGKAKLLEFWQTKHEDGFKPYCGIVIYFLSK